MVFGSVNFIIVSGLVGSFIYSRSKILRHHSALITKNANLETILGAISDAVTRVDYNGKIIDYRAPYNIKATLPPESVIGRSVFDFVADEFRDQARTALASAVAGRASTLRFSDEKSGKRRVFESRFVKGTNNDVVIVRQEQTARVAAEEKFSTAFKANSNPMSFTSMKTGKLVEINQAFTRFFGYSKEDAIGKSSFELGLSRDYEIRESYLNDVTVGKDFVNREIVLYCKDGSRKTGLVAGSKINMSDEGFILLSFYDISARKIAEAAMAESENRFRQVFDTSPTAFGITCYETGVFTEVNDAFETLTGYTKEEVLGKSTRDLNLAPDPVERERFYETLSAVDSFNNFSMKVRRKTGELINCLHSIKIFEQNGVKYLLANVVDQTERIYAENAMASALRIRQSVFENSGVAIFVGSSDRRILDMNKSACEMFGWAKGELVGKSVELIHLNEKTFHAFQIFVKDMFGKGVVDVEYPFKRKDGTQLWCSISGSLLDLENHDAGMIWILKDITERRNAVNQLNAANIAAERTNDKLRDATAQAQHLAELAETANKAKSEFLATMSHEIRTPLNGIVGLTELMKQSNLDDEQQRWLNMIMSNSGILLSIVSDILDMSKIDAGRLELEKVDFDLPDAVESVLQIQKMGAMNKPVSVTWTIADVVSHTVCGDPVRLKQVISNLVANAVKFTDEGSVTLKVEHDKSDISGNTLRFEVVDTGIGISQENLPKLFQPFAQADSSTTRNFGGTGLGLAICKRIAELMGGRIGVESLHGKGSTFWFTATLPPVSNAAQVDRRDSFVRPGIIRGARILIVEDNETNRIIAREMLRRFGCEVDMAEDGAAAIEYLRNNDRDLVIMDCQMPVMDGFESTRRIRSGEAGSRAAVLPIIAMTANALTGDREKCLASGMNDYLAKPVSSESLLKVLGRRLGEICSSRTCQRER